MIWPFARPALCGVVFLSVVTTAWLAPAAEKPSAQPGPSGAASSVPWSFQPLQKIEPPADPSGWSVDPVDSFIQEKLRAHNLQPAGPAEKRTLIRRATFDLTGLPPTPEEVEAFLADSSPDAWSKVVDRLLASPRYGEHWGRHWLDVVRYADTGGFEADLMYPNAWKYRDYVIRSFNADKPYNRFLQEQVAGDELWPNDPDAVLATAVYCVGPVLEESAMVSKQLDHEWLTDAADTTGAAFLGLTLGCARCHDHKYDPLTQKDYYAMQAFFGASDRPYPAPVRLLRIKTDHGLLSEAPVPKELLNDPNCTLRTEDQTGFRLFHREPALTVHLLRRGELSKPAEVMEPAFPKALSGQQPDLAQVAPGQRRAALARWLTAPDNPLTARVLVNRVCGWHFGQGLVRTPNDFGKQGEAPSHPELLDWLTRDFQDYGWSLKHLHRLILLSRTYQMESVARGSSMQVDPENRLLEHFPRRRLEAESLRDAMLACSGTLNLKAFGPPVVPPLSKEELTGLFDAKGKWPVTKDAAEHTRRSVYLLERRTFTFPLFAAYDPPEVMTSCPRRLQTVVPTQALTLINSPLAREQADAFARRLLRECGPNPEKVAARAWLLAFNRPIHQAEAEHVVEFLWKRTAALASSGSGFMDPEMFPDGTGEPAGEVTEAALAELCLALFNANEFVYVD